MSIEQLEPKRVWKHFHSLTRIPRPSKREEKVVEYMYNWGKSLGLETIKDEVGNIIIKKPATPGMEDRKGIIFQGHLDMVPQNNKDVQHDWDNDPVTTKVVGEWLYANGTTLGADNGLGCAAAMAVLEATDLAHGPIEALFTIDEETGMTGAKALKGGLLDGEILINLDSETEGELYVGCAGGLDATAEFEYEEVSIPAGYAKFEVAVKGLRGGHSGMEINEGRGNSNKIMARLLLPILRDMGGLLVSIEGGNLRNAIPREAVAYVALPTENVAKAKEHVDRVTAEASNEYKPIDPGLKIFFEECTCPNCPTCAIPASVGVKVMQAIYACPSGVDRMSLVMENLVETSNNLAIVKSEAGKLSVKTLMRGSCDTAKNDLSEAIRAVFELAGAKVSFAGGYSGWQPNMDSAILKAMKETYKGLYGVEPEVKAIHAGLECAIISNNYPHWDMISCGPTLMSPHSPEERVLIATVGKWWDFLVEVLKNAPKK